MTSQVVLHGSTSGTATLLAAAVSGAAVLTLPAATGTVALLADVTGGIATHAALQTGVHGISIAAGKTLTASNTLTLTATDGSTLAIGTGGTLGSAAYTATSAYEAAGGIATHAALTTGIHGLAITAGQTLTVTTGGTLGSAAYTASTAYEAAGGIATHAALQTGVHGISIAAGKTFTASNTLTLTATDGSTLAIGTGGTLGSAAYTATSAYEAAGGIATHAALTTGIHGLAITAGQTLTVTTGGTLGSAAYTASTAYEAAGGIATHAALTATHGVTGAIVGTTDAQTLTNKTITTFGGAFTFNPANLSATLSPTGTGTVTINPATAGAMDNVVIGANTRAAVSCTTLSASGLFTLGGGQIAFPASQNASADANTLDDYEEGTFTPSVIGDGTAGSGTYTTQLGAYVKIGTFAYVSLTLVWTAHTGTGNTRISGLPFATRNTANLFSVGNTAPYALAYTKNLIYTLSGANATTADLYERSGADANAQQVPLPSTGNINVTISYLT